MWQAKSNKLLIISFVLCIAAICLWFFTSKAALQSPTVAIAPQSFDAPLRIESADILSVLQSPRSDAISVEITVNIRVESYKPISAYSIGFKPESPNAPLGGSQLTNILSSDETLKSGQLKTLTLHVTQRLPAVNVVLFVDFVEFLDGTTWGTDTSKAADNLAGQRAGAKAATDQLKKAAAADGFGALIESSTEDLQIWTPGGHSHEWEEGFEMGVKITGSRFKKAHQKGGESEVKNELRQRYDAFDGRQKQ